MIGTLSGLELSLLWLGGFDKGLMQRIFVSVILSLESGKPARVSVQTTDGQYHYLEISTQISTDTASESGGPDKA